METYYYEFYQVNRITDWSFMSWNWAKKHNWSFKTYKPVWNGTEQARDNYDLLDYLFKKFNTNHPAGFKGHSMSVSDIVTIATCKEYEIKDTKYYYCDSFGWIDITKEVKGE